jgi:hypothetical protein
MNALTSYSKSSICIVLPDLSGGGAERLHKLEIARRLTVDETLLLGAHSCVMGIKGLLKKNPKDDREEHIPPAKPAIKHLILPTLHTLSRHPISEPWDILGGHEGPSRRRGTKELLSEWFGGEVGT